MSAPRLKNRQLQIPNGLTFYLPALKWSAPRGISFNAICDQLERVVRSNPALAQQHQWPTDRNGIEDWVDLYNATVCARMGWDKYIHNDGGYTVPKAGAPHQLETLQSLKDAAARAKALVSGAKTLTEYLDSGDPVVGLGLAIKRATVCSGCPANEAGDLTKWFTVPASEYIRRQLEKAQARKLETPRDDDLHICTACSCPLKLKIWIPIEWIRKNKIEGQDQKMRLANDQCWVLNEATA